MVKRGEIEKNFIRLFYLAMSDYPVNWLEGSYQAQFRWFKELNCIDNIFKIFDRERYEIMQKADVSIYRYIVDRPMTVYPKIQRQEYSQVRLAEYLTKLYTQIAKKFKKSDEKAKKLLEDLQVLENGRLPFDDFKQAIVSRAILFKVDPIDSRKGTNALVMFLILWGIKNNDIVGDGVEYLEKIAKTFLCFNKKALHFDIKETFEMVNDIFGTKYDIDIECVF